MENENLIQIWYNDITKQPFKKSEKTRDEYLKSINYFLEFVNKDIVDVTQRDVKLYMQSLDVSDSTYNTRLASISSLYKCLMYDVRTEELVAVNPTYGVIRVGVKNKKKDPLNNDEEKWLLQNAKNPRDYAFIMVMLNCGLRIDELCNLKLQQYLDRDENDGILLTHTKRSKERTIYLNDKVIDAIEEYLKVRKDGEDTLFTSNSGTKLLRTSTSRTLKNIARRSGMFTEERISEISNHLCRKTMCSDMINKGANIAVVQQLMGHSSIETTIKSYTKIDTTNVASLMKSYAI